MKTYIGDVELYRKNLGRMPQYPDGSHLFAGVKIVGHFDCATNKLTSLIGSPEIVTEDFNCSYNLIKSLDGCPREVYSFLCTRNQIQNLKGSPEIIHGHFSVEFCDLYSLEGAPKVVKGDFYCRGNPYKFSLHDVASVCDVRGKIYA